MSVVLKKLPGVLSFQRGTLVSDALFFNVFADRPPSPLHVIRHGIRGTQNVNKAPKSAGSTASSAARENVSNIQITDSAKLDPNAIALMVRFDIRFLPIRDLLFACAPSKEDKPADIAAMRENFQTFVNKAIGSDGLRDVAHRYARNIANGRFLWRNRMVASDVKVRVTSGQHLDLSFDALDVDLNAFADYSEPEQRVADVILGGMEGRAPSRLTVEATVDFGVRGALEVFPSQNYLENKERGFARPLYCVGEPAADQDKHGIQELGQAAFREQKVANALRTFDTWYPEYATRKVPIPIEPMGASLDAQEFFRRSPDTSGFQLMLRLGSLDPDSEQGRFMLACLIRGGVFSGTDKS
jgi:CRISPR-associated protein Csy3